MSGKTTPTEELIMSVLAARTRLGETYWTFSNRVRVAASKLEQRGLIETKAGVVENTFLAWLTDAGRTEALESSYRSPLERAIGDNLHILREHYPSGATRIERLLVPNTRIPSTTRSEQQP